MGKPDSAFLLLLEVQKPVDGGHGLLQPAFKLAEQTVDVRILIPDGYFQHLRGVTQSDGTDGGGRALGAMSREHGGLSVAGTQVTNDGRMGLAIVGRYSLQRPDIDLLLPGQTFQGAEIMVRNSQLWY